MVKTKKRSQVVKSSKKETSHSCKL